MNKVRRKQLSAMQANVQSLCDALGALRAAHDTDGMFELLSEMQSDEQEYFENMPEGLQGSERGLAAEEAVAAMEEGVSTLEEIESSFEELDSALASLIDHIETAIGY